IVRVDKRAKGEFCGPVNMVMAPPLTPSCCSPMKIGRPWAGTAAATMTVSAAVTVIPKSVERGSMYRSISLFMIVFALSITHRSRFERRLYSTCVNCCFLAQTCAFLDALQGGGAAICALMSTRPNNDAWPWLVILTDPPLQKYSGG